MPHACADCGRTFPDGSKEMLSGCPDCGGNKFRYHPESVSDAKAESENEDGPPRSPPNPDDEGIPARDQGVVDRATTTVREWVSQRSSGPATASPSPSGAVDARDEPSAPATDGATASSSESAPDSPEDTAQADARTGVADPDEIPDSPPDSDPTPATSVGGDGETPPAAGATPEASAADRDEPAASPSAHTRDRPAAEPADPASTPGASNLAQLREELNEQFESIKIVEPGEYELNLMDLYDREEYIISLKEDGRYAIEVPETWRDSEDVPE
jgi:predicted  nucleic acid-binding Zn-ribbon protein